MFLSLKVLNVNSCAITHVCMKLARTSCLPWLPRRTSHSASLSLRSESPIRSLADVLVLLRGRTHPYPAWRRVRRSRVQVHSTPQPSCGHHLGNNINELLIKTNCYPKLQAPDGVSARMSLSYRWSKTFNL